jgi:hypothetical protein
LRCTGCSNPDHCDQWLAQQEGVADKSPSYCRNTDLIERLLP